jgi:DNA repair photolyase
MAEMIAGHIATEARVAPILPGCTDDLQSLRQLTRAIAQTGVKRVAVSALFLRPAVASSLKRGIADKEMVGKLLGAYGDSGRLAVRAEHSSIMPLPRSRRLALFELVTEVAEEFGLEVLVCACMNPDIAAGTCNISGERQAGDFQPSLFGREA